MQVSATELSDCTIQNAKLWTRENTGATLSHCKNTKHHTIHSTNGTFMNDPQCGHKFGLVNVSGMIIPMVFKLSDCVTHSMRSVASNSFESQVTAKEAINKMSVLL